MKKVEKKETQTRAWTVRINTRILPSQHQFIKKCAQKNGLTEGDVVRMIIDTYMKIK